MDKEYQQAFDQLKSYIAFDQRKDEVGLKFSLKDQRKKLSRST